MKDFELVMAVEFELPGTVKLTKVTADPSPNEFDVVWLLRDGTGTRIGLDVRANLAVSRFVPLGGIGDTLAEGFIGAARNALEGS